MKRPVRWYLMFAYSYTVGLFVMAFLAVTGPVVGQRMMPHPLERIRVQARYDANRTREW